MTGGCATHYNIACMVSREVSNTARLLMFSSSTVHVAVLRLIPDELTKHLWYLIELLVGLAVLTVRSVHQ